MGIIMNFKYIGEIIVSNINDIFKMIIENKEWLFSGIGNTIGSALLNMGKNKKSVDSYITNVINYYNETEKDKKSENHGVSLSKIAFLQKKILT